MQNISNKNKSNQPSVPLMSPTVISCQSWLNSSDSQLPKSSLSNARSLNTNSSHQRPYKDSHSSHHPQEQDSSSTQSTGQSHLEVPAMDGDNPRRHSGCEEMYEKRLESHMKSVLSLGTPDFIFPTPQVDYSHSVGRISYPCPDSYFGGLLAPYGSQMIHPSMVGMAFARIPLPLDPAEDEPIFVNPKQYHGILRRRESRAKLEAQNKLIKARKPYLHESRHLHALKRVRGNGGRFLNTKKSQESEPTPNDGQNDSGAASQLESKVILSETSGTGGSAASCSETTSMSNGYSTLQISDLRYSNYASHMNGTLRGEGGSIMCNGPQYRVPVIR